MCWCRRRGRRPAARACGRARPCVSAVPHHRAARTTPPPRSASAGPARSSSRSSTVGASTVKVDEPLKSRGAGPAAASGSVRSTPRHNSVPLHLPSGQSSARPVSLRMRNLSSTDCVWPAAERHSSAAVGTMWNSARSSTLARPNRLSIRRNRGEPRRGHALSGPSAGTAAEWPRRSVYCRRRRGYRALRRIASAPALATALFLGDTAARWAPRTAAQTSSARELWRSAIVRRLLRVTAGANLRRSRRKFPRDGVLLRLRRAVGPAHVEADRIAAGDLAHPVRHVRAHAGAALARAVRGACVGLPRLEEHAAAKSARCVLDRPLVRIRQVEQVQTCKNRGEAAARRADQARLPVFHVGWKPLVAVLGHLQDVLARAAAAATSGRASSSR